jgi:hypothetical protein
MGCSKAPMFSSNEVLPQLEKSQSSIERKNVTLPLLCNSRRGEGSWCFSCLCGNGSVPRFEVLQMWRHKCLLMVSASFIHSLSLCVYYVAASELSTFRGNHLWVQSTTRNAACSPQWCLEGALTRPKYWKFHQCVVTNLGSILLSEQLILQCRAKGSFI